MLIRNVRMVTGGCELGRASTQTIKVVFPEVDAVELDVVFDVRTDRMHV